jgi:hypothetical protein
MIVLKSEIVPVPSPPTLLSMMMFSNKMIFSNKSLVTLKVCTIQIGIKANERLISVWHTSEVESDATLTDVDWRSSTLSEFVWTCLKHAIGQGLDRRWRNDRLFLNGLSDSNYKSILGFCHKCANCRFGWMKCRHSKTHSVVLFSKYVKIFLINSVFRV